MEGMKRTLAPVLTSVAMLIAGTAAAEPSGDPFDGKLRPIPPGQTMRGDEVVAYALPYLPRVARCYKQHVARKGPGTLALYLVIGRTGRVVHSEITAPGVTRKVGLERCLRKEVTTWRFPAQTGFTNATIPYFFLQTPAPSNEPLLTS
jgi:hypothetical protein